MTQQVLAQIEKALLEITELARAGYQAAGSIETQLKWCKAYLGGLPTTRRPGPFSMGLIATREFDMYGDDPELASLINEIQMFVDSKLKKQKL